MANYDNPNGFRPVSFPARTNVYEVKAATTVTKGDALAIVSGVVLPYAAASHSALIGGAAQDGTGGDEIQVYDDASTEFEGQCSGSFVKATYIGTAVDIEGATGVMEVNEDDATDIVTILGHYPLTGADEVGANARVKFVITSHVNLG